MWQKHLSLLVAVLALFCLHHGNGQIATYVVQLKSLLQMQQGIGWPLYLNVAEGHEALMRLTNTLENQQSCVVTTPSGITFNVHNPPSAKYEAWSDGCGLRVRSVVPTDEGRWRLTASRENHTITGWSEVHVAEKISTYTPDVISLQDGQTFTQVDLSSLNNSYCLVAKPFTESSLIPGHCHVTLDRTTRAVQGKWSILLGIPGRVTELHVDRRIAVESERLDVGFVRDENNHKLNLYCNILHTAKNITFCRFQKNTDASGFNIMDGLSDGRYSYYGEGFSKRQCGMTIESVTADDYGTWRCTVGVQEWSGTTIHQRTPMQALISVPAAPGGTRTKRDIIRSENEVRTLFVQKDSTLTIMCRANETLIYCWFQHPNGSQFTPLERQNEEQQYWYTGENLQTGDCGITFAHVSEEDGGTWTCHMGYKYELGIEKTDKVSVRVTGSLAANKEEVGATIGSTATLYCHTSNGPRPLDYCRFLAPNFVGITLDSSVTEENAILNRFYFTPGRSLDYGDCSLTIDPVLEEDFGEWTCAGLLHDDIVESRANVNFYYDINVVRSSQLRAGLIGTSAGIVVLALVLAGFVWNKKGRPVPWSRPGQRFSNRTDATSATMDMQSTRTDSIASDSTNSSEETERRP